MDTPDVAKAESQHSLKADINWKGSTSNISNFSSSKKYNPEQFFKRTLEWKREKDSKIVQMRKEKLNSDLNSWSFNPQLVSKQYKSNADLESLCPVIHASKIEKRTQMRIQMNKRWESKDKPKSRRVSKTGYSKMCMTQRAPVNS